MADDRLSDIGALGKNDNVALHIFFQEKKIYIKCPIKFFVVLVLIFNARRSVSVELNFAHLLV